jgi:hypothetical protein
MVTKFYKIQMKFENHEICQVLMISYEEVVKKMENVGASFLPWWASGGREQARCGEG